MHVTIEISMYPLHADYKDLILDFIDKLNTYGPEGLKISTSATSTLVSGPYRRVMEILADLLEWSHEKHGRAVFVAKIIPGLDPDA